MRNQTISQENLTHSAEEESILQKVKTKEDPTDNDPAAKSNATQKNITFVQPNSASAAFVKTKEDYSPETPPYFKYAAVGPNEDSDGTTFEEIAEKENRTNSLDAINEIPREMNNINNINGNYSEELEEKEEKEEKEERVLSLSELDWDGPDDKDNPQSWSKFKKWWITYTAAIMCLCCSLGSSMYTSGIPEIMIRFGSSQELCLSGLTFYLIGLALGPAIAAPLSEVFGRKPLYVYSWPIAMLFIMGVGLAKNMRTLLVLRFFCGFFSSPALSIAGGTISDLWANRLFDQSIAVAIFCLCPFLGPVLGPIIGGFAAEHKNWQWAASWVLLMFFGAIWPFAILAPETFKPVILSRRAQKRGLKVDTPKLNMEFFKKVIRVNLLMPLVLLASEPIVLIMSIYIAFIFAVLFGFFEAFPVIFRGVYRMSLGVSGLPFIAVGLGLILGVLFYTVLDFVYYFPKNADGTRGNKDENGKIIIDSPEKKLLVGKIGAICLPIALFWLGWSGRTQSVHWMAPAVSGVPFGFGLILVFFSVLLYFALSFPPVIVASAIAANNLLRYLLASVFPLFTVQCFENLGIGWAGSLFGFIALIMVPVPFVFERYGARLRNRSKFGYAAYFRKLAEEKALKKAEESENNDVDVDVEENYNQLSSDGSGIEEKIEVSQKV